MLTARRNRSRCAPLLRADDEHPVVVLLAGVADQLVLFERERQRLLAEDVLAGLQGLDGDLHVPVVGRDDAHHVDVLAIEHLAVVAVGVGLALADARDRSWRARHGASRRRRRPRCRRTGRVRGRRRMPMPPTPMQPILGRSLAEALANACWLQAKYGTALPAAATATDFFKKSRREC